MPKDITYSPVYVDLGKLLDRTSASEFTTLAYSDPNLQQFAQKFYDTLDFPEREGNRPPSLFIQRPQANGVGNVSIAQIELDPSRKDFIFGQIQRRRDGEFSQDPKTDGPFNQVRFSYLTRDVIARMYRNQISFYSSLLFRSYSKGSSIPSYRMRDYVIGKDTPGIRRWTIDLDEIDFARVDMRLVAKIANVLIDNFKVFNNPNTRGRIFKPPSVLFIKPGLNLEKKLALIDAVQYYVFPMLGPITFALDQVTNQTVMFCFYDVVPPNRIGLDPSLIYSEERLMSAEVEDTFATLAGLDPADLYHETLQHYLAKDIAPTEAVSLYSLEEKKPVEESPEPQNPIDQLLNNQAVLSGTPEHLSRILDPIKPEEIVKLIASDQLSPAMTQAVLGYEVKKAGRNLFAYFPFHLAVPAQKRQEAIFNRRVTALLQEAIQNSFVEILDEIPEEDREAIYYELLLARNKDSSGDEPPGQKTSTLFAPSTGPTGVSVLQGLLRRFNPDLLNTVLKFLREEDAVELISDIHTELKQSASPWKAAQLFTLWEVFGNEETDLYLTFLKLFTDPADEYGGLAQKPDEFKQFLLRQPALFARAGASLDPGLEQQVRAVCLEVSRPIRAENVRFAEWWFYSQIYTAEQARVLTDYGRLLEIYALVPEQMLEMAGAEFRFLVTGGKLEKQLSLRTACKQNNGENQPETTNESFFRAALDAWIEKGCPIRPADIAYLVDRLPETNDLLARIVHSNAQAGAVTDINAATALKWLKNSFGYGILRGPYLNESGSDLLVERLGHLVKPETDFVWQLLIEDKSTTFQSIAWADYVKLWDQLIERMNGEQLTQSLELHLFYDLARKVADSQHIGALNRRAVKVIAHLNTRSQLNTVELEDKDINGLCSFILNEQDPYLQKLAVSSLQNFLQAQRLSYIAGEIKDVTIKLLLQIWEKFQLDKRMSINLKNEYRKRFGESYKGTTSPI